MTDTGIETAAGKSATIEFNGQLCIHARRCVLSQPTVFKANVQGPWIDPDAASAEALMYVALNCPSGAIRVSRHDGGANETSPKVNIVSVARTIRAAGDQRGDRAGGRADRNPRDALSLRRVQEQALLRRFPRRRGVRRHRRAGDKESAQLARRDGPLESRPIRMDPSASPVQSRSFPEPGAQ